MRILLNLENTDDFREIYIELMDSLESLKYIIEAEFNIPTFQQYIKYENKFLENEKLSIKNYNIKDDEILVVGKRQQAINLKNNLPGASSNINTNKQNNISKIFEDTMQIIKQNPQGQGGQRVQSLGNNFDNLFSFDSRVKSECVKIKELYTNNPDELNYLFFQDPKLAEIIVSMDDKALEEIVRERLTKIEEKRKKESDEYNKLWSADPNDPESQKKIEEFIRLKNIEENFKMAQEYLPESLLSVHMLFINLEINKHKIVALVDTGAQSTIISEDLAKRFGIFNLCDTRYSGIAKGVGTSKILGIIHAALMKIGDKFVHCKLTVIENNSIGFIFGLDNMRCHRCSIDLSKNCLIFPDANIKISFISDGEIKKLKIEEEENEIEMSKQKSLDAENKFD